MSESEEIKPAGIAQDVVDLCPGWKDVPLSLEDYNQLPDTLKAYEGRAQNKFFNVTPAVLRFPHDDRSQHVAKLVVWNKSKRHVEFRLQKPRTSFFGIFYEKTHLYAGTEETILVRCDPKGQRLCFDSIQIHIRDEPGESILIPLELLPSASWFVMPKFILMPVIPIGRSYEINVALPEPPMSEEALYFIVMGGDTETLTVTPAEGYIGGQPSATTVYTRFLTVSYHPKEYLSLAHTFSLRFPQVDDYMKPYEITAYLRCIPGYESEIILRSIDQLQLPPQPPPSSAAKKLKNPVTRLKTRKGFPVTAEPEKPMVPNLTTQAAVMKFLISPGDKFHMPLDEIPSPFGAQAQEQYRIYRKKEQEFHDRLNHIEIQQHSMHLQHTKAFQGEDPVEADSLIYEGILVEREKVMAEYLRLVGMQDDQEEDMRRRKVKVNRQRCIRDVDVKYVSEGSKSSARLNLPPTEGKNPQQAARLERLRRFIQAARLVIIRRRADKRIVKLRLLILEIKARQVEEEAERARRAELARIEAQLESLRRFSTFPVKQAEERSSSEKAEGSLGKERSRASVGAPSAKTGTLGSVSGT